MGSHFLTMNDTPTTNIVTLWETLKAVIRGQFIAIAARQNAVKRQQLEDDIQALEVTHRQTGCLVVRRQLTIQQKQLRALDEDKVEYALLRTNQKFYTGGEQGGSIVGSQTPYTGHGMPGGRTKVVRWYPYLSERADPPTI
ncbi:hypothetical protein NDU88_004993 [Pleurodeles waltl]|uniref:Uncharacterized protein n=1 Tax=Pleurodeles waltl TaxID=8319 RepID=A0AAV7UGS0_PLEWA|nr:hypothetical protein NDU88_004993 [Pleurodeles waltl]